MRDARGVMSCLALDSRAARMGERAFRRGIQPSRSAPRLSARVREWPCSSNGLGESLNSSRHCDRDRPERNPLRRELPCALRLLNTR